MKIPARATYILPIRVFDMQGAGELARYLTTLRHCDVIVVDGSRRDVFEAYDRALRGVAQHVRPDPAIVGTNGKVCGVLTGLALAGNDRIVVADDDVRYDEPSFCSVLDLLDAADVVRPQNYFDPLPWHAVVDGARSLINRALDGDWPGTLAFRKSAIPKGYSANVLFENYELVRTAIRRGGKELVARDVFVRRLPPSARHFWSQRVRQAYDEFARPIRMLAALAILPVLAFAWAERWWQGPLSLVLASLALAFAGWMRNGAHRYFPLICVLVAPLWVVERAICAWLAVFERLRFGGVRYGDAVISAAASTPQELKRRCA